MKKKLMMIFAFMLSASGCAAATWMQSLKMYYVLTSYVVQHKFKSFAKKFNIFGKASGSSQDPDDDDFSFDNIDNSPKKEIKFKKYRRTKTGKLILPQIKR